MDDSVASIVVGDDIKPYKIHVSTKYLELTKKKLELTRLPHEILLPKSRIWEQGTPKSEIEPLIDFWLEQYSWRTQESELNKNLPQFRTAITIPSSPTPFRIHFTHAKSPHGHALPLLLLPTFPLTSLSLEPLLKPLTHPNDPQTEQPFHVIAPSIPGLGFSDAFNTAPGSESSVVEDTAQIFNSLMLKLGYQHYIASSTGSGIKSPANIDYQLPRILASKYQNDCLGIHIIDPPVPPPILSFSLLNWMKFAIARFFHASIFGYTATDWAALKGSQRSEDTTRGKKHSSEDVEAAAAAAANHTTSSTPLITRPLPSSHGPRSSFFSYSTTGHLGLREPNTLAYALCDSPVGLLSLVLNSLQRLSPGHSFDRTEIINLTQLAWLPGPEGAMRFWSDAEAEASRTQEKRQRIAWSPTPTAVTVFLGAGDDDGGGGGGAGAHGDGYVCPAWAATRHNVVWSRRQEGRGGLIAWERKEAIVEGIRGLAGEALKTDSRLSMGVLEDVVVMTSAYDDDDNVIVEEEEDGEDCDAAGMQLDIESPATVIAG